MRSRSAVPSSSSASTASICDSMTARTSWAVAAGLRRRAARHGFNAMFHALCASAACGLGLGDRLAIGVLVGHVARPATIRVEGAPRARESKCLDSIGMSQSTAPRSPRRRRITRRAAMSRSPRRSSRRPPRSTPEDELYGEARVDELPQGLRTSGGRRNWPREAKQALEAQRAAKAKKGMLRGGRRRRHCTAKSPPCAPRWLSTPATGTQSRLKAVSGDRSRARRRPAPRAGAGPVSRSRPRAARTMRAGSGCRAAASTLDEADPTAGDGRLIARPRASR